VLRELGSQSIGCSWKLVLTKTVRCRRASIATLKLGRHAHSLIAACPSDFDAVAPRDLVHEIPTGIGGQKSCNRRLVKRMSRGLDRRIVLRPFGDDHAYRLSRGHCGSRDGEGGSRFDQAFLSGCGKHRPAGVGIHPASMLTISQPRAFQLSFIHILRSLSGAKHL